jgi:type IV pilus assembly protein PilM
MSQTVIGLDIGSYSVKAAVVETGLRKYQWVEFCEHLWNRDADGSPVDEDLSDAVTAVLERVSDRNAIVTSIPGAKILNRELTLPFSNDKEIRNVLDFELDGQFPMAIDDLVYDYTILEKEPGGSSKILCSAVERKWFEKFLSELTEAGANPRIVCMDTLAAGELVTHAGQVSAYGPPDDTDAVALIDIGHMTTSVCIVRGNVVEMVRTIKRGGHHLTKAIMDVASVSYQEAESIKHEMLRLDGEPSLMEDEAQARAIQTAISTTLSPLLRDLRTTLHAHANNHVIGVVRGMLYGGTAKMPGLRELLAEHLNIQIERPRCFSFDWAQEELGPEGEEIAPKAASLALRYVSDGQKDSVNFRQGDLAFESEFKALKDKGIWFGVLLLLLVGILFTRIAVQKSVLEENQAKLEEKLGSFTEETFGERMTDLQAALGKVQSPPKSEGDGVIPEMTGFQAYYEIWQATNIIKEMKVEEEADAVLESDGEETDEEDFRIQIERISLPAYGKIGQVQGKVASVKVMTAFQELLDKHPCMQLTQDPDYTGAKFTMRLKIECAKETSSAKKKEQKKETKTTGASKSAK